MPPRAAQIGVPATASLTRPVAATAALRSWTSPGALTPARLVGVVPRGEGDDLLLGRARGDLPGDASLVHHDDPVAEADQLGQLRRDHDDRPAPTGQVADEVVDGGLRADVDAARRLVEQQHAARAPATWPARPSAGCRRTAPRLPLQARPPVARWRSPGPDAVLLPAAIGRVRTRPRGTERVAVSPIRFQSSSRACDFRSSGAKPRPAAIERSGRPGGTGRPSSSTSPAIPVVDAVDRPQAARCARRRPAHRSRAPHLGGPRSSMLDVWAAVGSP